MSVPDEPAEGRGLPGRQHQPLPIPAGVSLVAMLVVGALAVLVFGSRGLFGIGLAPSPTPEPTVEPTAMLDPTPTLEPTPVPTAEPTPTLEPTPTPVSAWTGLAWSEPIVQPDQGPPFRVTDSLWWHDRYIGIGVVGLGAGGIPLFLESADGINWDVVQEMEEYRDVQGDTDAHPVRVVPAGDGLVAMSGYILGGDRVIWQSADGGSWIQTDSSVHGFAIAGGPAGVVVIGAQGSGCCMNPDGPAIIGHSIDGLAWTWLSDAPVFAHASFTDVGATSTGFVIVGWIGETEAAALERGSADPHGRPAAWFSPDGMSWVAAPVEGAEDAEGGLGKVLVGADGSLAIGGLKRQPTAWISSDGQSWSRADLDAGMLVATLSMSDGTRMVILGREEVATTDLAAWASSDGLTWTRLTFSGNPAPSWSGFVGADGSWSHGDALAVLEEARLQRDNLVVRGAAADTSDPDGPWTPVSWVASAIER